MLYLSDKDRGNLFLILESIDKILAFIQEHTNYTEFYQTKKLSMQFL